MQKHQLKSTVNKIWRTLPRLFTLVLIRAYSSTSLDAAPALFQYKYPSKIASSSTVSTISSNFSAEIWTRLRNRFTITAPQLSSTSPRYHKHLRNYAHSQDYINKVANNASLFLFYVLEEVEKRGMPSEIALLPIIESDFNPHCKSSKGALGIWQIMPSHGLKQNAWYNGRKDVYESTKVALDYLQYLHKRFNNNWLLALAAYNWGEAKISRAIKQNRAAKKPTDFWSLKLPSETSDFVPKLLALATIIKSPKQYGVYLPPIPNKAVFARINTSTTANIAQAVKSAELTETQLRRLNPGINPAIFQKSQRANRSYSLLIPIQKAEKFRQKVKA